MIHYFYGTLQVGIGQTLCSFEHVSCFVHKCHTAGWPEGIQPIKIPTSIIPKVHCRQTWPNLEKLQENWPMAVAAVAFYAAINTYQKLKHG